VTTSLPPQIGVTLEQHLSSCPRCRQEVDDQRDFEDIRTAYQNIAPPAPAPPEVPSHVVQQWLGRGGFGEVWRGLHEGLQQPRAFKFLRTESITDEDLGTFCREARIMATFPRHPHLVQVHDLIVQQGDDGRPRRVVLVMDYIAGGPLSKKVPLPWEQAVRYVIHVAEGLREVHRHGLLHRDIKPDNIFYDSQNGVAVLGDFGLAARDDGQAGLAGTRGYLAPELADRPASVKSDVYALAATLFHLTTGARPFADCNLYESLCLAREGLPRPLPSLSQLPKGVEEVIRAGMEPDPEQRPDLDRFLALLRTAHSHELAEQLRALARHSSGAARLQVAVSASAVQPLAFRPVLSCSSRDAAPVMQVRPGDVLRLEVMADADGHLTVLNFSDAGKEERLVPGPLSQDDALRVGQTQRLTVRLTPPGPDHLALIWTPRTRTPERGVEFVLHESGVTPDDWTAVVLTVVQQET
jgi:hypothetical protein